MVETGMRWIHGSRGFQEQDEIEGCRQDIRDFPEKQRPCGGSESLACLGFYPVPGKLKRPKGSAYPGRAQCPQYTEDMVKQFFSSIGNLQ